MLFAACGRAESITCDLPDMSRDAFMSAFEDELDASDGDCSEFTFSIGNDSYKEAEPSDTVSSVKVSLNGESASHLSRDDIRTCVRALIEAAFSGKDSRMDEFTDSLMASYDSGHPVSIDDIDGYRLYCSFSSGGGSMIIEPYCEKCVYDLQS